MTGAVLCMAFYNVWSRRFIVRTSALGFLSVGMGAGGAVPILTGVYCGLLSDARNATKLSVAALLTAIMPPAAR
jgi:hypothetical protein